MNAALIAVGTELLDLGRRDTNSDWLTERLLERGVRITSRVVVGDDVESIAAQVRCALGRADLVIVSGGLGPTGDDLTRQALATALDLPLERDAAMADRLATRFRSHGREFGEHQRGQADRPSGARWLLNGVGIAPGFVVESRGGSVAALPGVPSELRAMFEHGLVPLLAHCAEAERRVLKVAGRTESWVDERIRDLYDLDGARVTILARPGGIEIALQVEGGSASHGRDFLDGLDSRISERLGEDLFGRDGDTLASVTGAMLGSAGLTVATAESCTAGLLAAAVTEVPGSSQWFRGGVVAYSDDLKTSLAGVSPASIAEHGAVSAAVARELAGGVRRRLGADLGVAVTGIAGPAGGTAEKPVGLVHVAVDAEDRSAEREMHLGGGRDLVRRRSVSAALDLLRRCLLESRPAQ
jgi:nicotinamide-nucleotide amidase